MAFFHDHFFFVFKTLNEFGMSENFLGAMQRPRSLQIIYACRMSFFLFFKTNTTPVISSTFHGNLAEKDCFGGFFFGCNFVNHKSLLSAAFSLAVAAEVGEKKVLEILL